MNQKILTASLAALVLTTGAFSVQAADSVPMYSLDAVVVTANRVPEKKIDANADVAVVTADEIAQKHYSDVSQAVSTVPGVFLSNHGGNAQVYQTNSIYINGSSNVVVLVDGVRRNINGITGTAANLGEMINMDSIDHIEVLKGSASTLYGSDAQGGVINVITKKPAENAVHTTLKTSFGNNSTENYSFYNEGKEGKVFWTAEAGKELMGDFCRGCGYCMPCPAGIEINNCARMSLMIRRAPSAAQLTPEMQAKMMKIEDCLHCGACMKKCPYHLNTPELLQKNLKDYKEILAGKKIG